MLVAREHAARVEDLTAWFDLRDRPPELVNLYEPTPQPACYRHAVCGRFTHLYAWKQLHRLLALTTPPIEFKERYNVAPVQDAPVVRNEAGGGRSVAMLRWGLAPPWAKDSTTGGPLINARAETIATKPAFRTAFAQRRCVVPASGFYEWQKIEELSTGLFGTATSKPKRATTRPFYFTRADGEPLLLAGLWGSWHEPSTAVAGEPTGGPLGTFTIITTTPNELIAKVHDRMPVILDPSDCGRWLDCTAGDTGDLVDLLRAYPADLMRCHRVSNRVNRPCFDDPACTQPIDR